EKALGQQRRPHMEIQFISEIRHLAAKEHQLHQLSSLSWHRMDWSKAHASPSGVKATQSTCIEMAASTGAKRPIQSVSVSEPHRLKNMRCGLLGMVLGSSMVRTSLPSR